MAELCQGTREWSQLKRAGLDHVMGAASQASPAGRTLPVACCDTGIVSAIFPSVAPVRTTCASQREGGRKKDYVRN